MVMPLRLITRSPGEGAAVSPKLVREDWGYRYTFHAMASPCEVRIDLEHAGIAEAAGRVVETEAHRIERKFSRYRDDSVLAQINKSSGIEVHLDDETSQLIDFAADCYRTSGGLFDITSGVLRRAWKFDGSDHLPAPSEIEALKRLIGWRRVIWRNSMLKLQPGMEIDLGGLGKEYAVDCALDRVREVTDAPVLINFGGDLRVSGPRSNGAPWKVALESVEVPGTAAGLLDLSEGALATSGDLNRFLLKDGIRYGHILSPLTGWPVIAPPRSVTVAAASCIEAGTLATLAMLQGRRAEIFLGREAVRAWCLR